ncbi:MAG: hypothetical protein K9M99_02145 [Candidatus Cloacimonetes bacterium]|nr:hypothetical protein [Candidatus Cloacimonadota bacterium]
MPLRENGNYVSFIESFCEIHGRFGDKVYRRKRNGQPWVYEYVYKPKYAPTVLSRRTSYIARAAARISNPRYKGYRDILQKIYYFTPYFVYAGNYSFSCNTFFKLRFAGDYGIELDGSRISLHLAPRTKLNFAFDEAGEYEIKCYKDGRLYSRRQVIVIDAESDLEEIYTNWFNEHLEEIYTNWFNEHLAEILSWQLPCFGKKKVYRRGIIPPAWVQYLVGKTEQGILYRSSYRERFLYSRQSYAHVHSSQGDYFYRSQKQVTECWNASTADFKQVWEKYHIRWFDANYRKNWKIVRQHNLWSKLVFQAGGILGFDLEELTPDNWLWGVETLGDLLEVCGMGRYGLSVEDLGVRIF